jgi:integrase
MFKVPERPIPPVLANKLHKYGFFDTTDTELRLNLAVKILSIYRLSTATRYFNVLKYGGYFGDIENTKHLSLKKENFSTKAPQLRLPEPEKFQKLLEHLHSEFKKNFTDIASTHLRRQEHYLRSLFAIFLCWNTGLRISTILSFTNKHLQQLLSRSMEIEIKNKNSNTWIVVYHKQFTILLDIMKQYFINYLQLDLEIRLFPFERTYLLSVLRKLYIDANNGAMPPTGFGLHSVRYYIASEFAKKNLKSAQELLGHKSLKTTKIYVKYRHNMYQGRLEELEQRSELFKSINDLFTAKQSD